MTKEKQDILEDFYSGNAKKIRVTIYDDSGNLKDLTDAELTYALFTRETNELILRKSSHKGEHEIRVVGPGLCEIYYIGADTVHIHGTFRHHLNVVDADGKEATAFTGLVRIHRTPAGRYREVGGQAYTEGKQEKF